MKRLDITEEFELPKDAIQCLDKGFVRLIDHMGDDASIVQMARVSYGDGTKSVSDDEKLIRYLMRNRHSSPFEGVQFKFHIRLPIFVSNQWVRHRTWSYNQMSARYSIMPYDCYIPEVEHVTSQDPDNKQGGTNHVLENADYLREHLADDQDYLAANYQWRINQGMRRELARINLPMAQYTEMYATVNLHNLLHFLRLRMDKHAQYEIRVYAEALYKIIQPIVPITCQAFEDYQLNGVYLTGKDVELLKSKLAFYIGKDDRMNITEDIDSQKFDENTMPNKREYKEFKEKMKKIGLID